MSVDGIRRKASDRRFENGNAYILEERDQRGVVVGSYVLDPSKVKVPLAPGGDLYYEIRG